MRSRAAAASTCSVTRACPLPRSTLKPCLRASPTRSSRRRCTQRGRRGSTSGRAGATCRRRALGASSWWTPTGCIVPDPGLSTAWRSFAKRSTGRAHGSADNRVSNARGGRAGMSKAFTSEETPDDDELPDDPSPLPAGARNYMTPGGFARLRDELDHLVQKERPELVSVVSWAAGNGDRSENGDYLYGKKRLREIDRRIRFLIRRLDRAEVVDPGVRRDDDGD